MITIISRAIGIQRIHEHAADHQHHHHISGKLVCPDCGHGWIEHTIDAGCYHQEKENKGKKDELGYPENMCTCMKFRPRWYEMLRRRIEYYNTMRFNFPEELK